MLFEILGTYRQLPWICGWRSSRLIGKERIAITFDDGYLDNYLVAKPLLEKYNLPATFFITSRNIGNKAEFWWDELEYIILETIELPQQISLELNGNHFFFDLEKEAKLTETLREKHKDYVAFNPVSLRSQLYLKIWEYLTPLNAMEQEKEMEKIRRWAGTTAAARAEYTCMSSEQLVDLSSGSLFSLEGHTATHPALAHHAKEVQREEIRSNKSFLKDLTNKEVGLFAYPSGVYNDSAVEVLKEEGFDAGFTTDYGYVSREDNPFLLNRLQVNNWDGKAFEWVISKCLEGAT